MSADPAAALRRLPSVDQLAPPSRRTGPRSQRSRASAPDGARPRGPRAGARARSREHAAPVADLRPWPRASWSARGGRSLLAPPGHQRHRRRPAHQSGPGAAEPAGARAARGRRRTPTRNLELDLGTEGARLALQPRGRPAAAPDRRRGRAGGQQQRGRRAPGPRVAGPRPRGHRLAGRADRDRRRVPHPRHHAAERRACCARSARRTGRTCATTPRRSRPTRRCCSRSTPRTTAWSASPPRSSSRELVELGRERGIPVMEDLGLGLARRSAALGLPVRADGAGGRGRRRRPGLVLRRQAARRAPGRHRRRPARDRLAAQEEPVEPGAADRQVHDRGAGGDAARLRGGNGAADRAHARDADRAARRGAKPRAPARARAPRAGRAASVSGASLVDDLAQVGGGALPTVELPTVAVAVGTSSAAAMRARRGAARRRSAGRRPHRARSPVPRLPDGAAGAGDSLWPGRSTIAAARL